MQRREFLAALCAMGILPGRAAIAGERAASVKSDRAVGRTLVLIELKGGNDGLNTVVPVADPAYRKLRPSLGLSVDEVLPLDERLALHPALEPLMRLWERGDLAIVNGVGYDKPNRSHFRSTDIWETASDSDETRVEGWLHPVLDVLPSRGGNVKGVSLDPDEGPFAGSSIDSVFVTELQSFVRQARILPETRPVLGNPVFDHLIEVERATHRAARAFEKNLQAVLDAREGRRGAEQSLLARKLETVADLISLDVGPQVYKVTLGGFDTHTSQAGRQARLLAQLADGVRTLERKLVASGRWSDVLVMTYSEFGRRASENASGGTDHGTAAPHFIAGGSVRGGLIGPPPDLRQLNDGDLDFSIDFRRMYNTASREWFGLTLAEAPFSRFKTLPILS